MRIRSHCKPIKGWDIQGYEYKNAPWYYGLFIDMAIENLKRESELNLAIIEKVLYQTRLKFPSHYKVSINTIKAGSIIGGKSFYEVGAGHPKKLPFLLISEPIC